ncbi:MAG: hypothetical protein K2Z25_22230 [Beijerinckiaceae bacterium]|nr:hypothetical protein [Beijerinckiaceae bacterium]
MTNVLEFILVVVISVAMMVYVVAQSFSDVSKSPPLGLPFYCWALLPFIYLAARLLIRRLSSRPRQR